MTNSTQVKMAPNSRESEMMVLVTMIFLKIESLLSVKIIRLEWF